MTARIAWLTIREYCAVYHVSRQTVLKWITNGDLGFYQHGRVLRVADALPSPKPTNYAKRKQ